MFDRLVRRRWALLIAAALALPLSSASFVAAQEPSAPAAEAPKKDVKKPRGRLPMYFGKVVNSEQREKIYAIQATYQEQIDQLLLQVRDLEQKREAEVLDVLTPEQQKQVADMVAEARQRRATLRSAGQPPATESPATSAAETP